jgi:hypothetical protein
VRDQTSFRLRDLFRSLFLLFRSLEGRQRRQHGPLLAEESSLQVAEISRYSPDEEITSICADFLVADAVRPNRSAAGALKVLGFHGTPLRWYHRRNRCF